MQYTEKNHRMELVDDLLRIRFIQERHKGTPLSSLILKETETNNTALYKLEMLAVLLLVMANRSDGKNRHGIHMFLWQKIISQSSC